MKNNKAPAAINAEMPWDQVYGEPEKTGLSLISRQGSNKYYLGTCGIVACANVLLLAGYEDITEDSVRYKAQLNGLCKADSIVDSASSDLKKKTALANGETSAQKRKDLLDTYDLPSELEDQHIPEIAKHVIAGRGVILSVYAGKLWEDPAHYNNLHAVTVIGVKKDATGVVIQGFYICDSGRCVPSWDEDGNEVIAYEKDQARYYNWKFLQNALSDMPMNVTEHPIRLKGEFPE